VPSPFHRLGAASLAVILMTPAAAFAHRGGVEPQSAPPPQVQVTPAATPNVPAPPIFPKHRRGLYLDGLGLWVIDAMPQSPPLETDDPGVPERGEAEINLTTRGSFAGSTKNFDLLRVDANYGLVPKLFGRDLPAQLAFEVPVAASKESDQPLAVGVGTAQLGLKLNFYNSERHSVEMAFYPQIEFVMGSHSTEKGLSDPGQTLVFPLLVSRELKYVTVVVNGAVEKPLNDPDRHTTGTAGLAFGVAVTRKFAIMAELHGETRFDFAHDRLVNTNVGVMRAMGHSFVFYANLGHSLCSDDGEGHTDLGLGVKVLIKARAKPVR
jgi:hypothetical protein